MDSNPSEINALFAKDVFGYSLDYYANDYTAINGLSPKASIQVASLGSVGNPGTTNSHAAANSYDLYNGNIRFMQTTLTNPLDRTKMPMLNAYKYDQLNRLKESRSYENGLSGNTWNPTGYRNEYFNAFTYDAMGNILTQERHNRAGQKFDDLEYHYQKDANGNLLRNRLYSVSDDSTLASVMEDDIEDMEPFISAVNQINTNNNYSYDAEGRLVKDRQEEIDTIICTVSGKVKEIRRSFESTKKNLIFEYDAFGNRIAKQVYDNQTLMLEKSTYYILDAQGNQLSMYEHAVDDTEVNYYLTERNIYGSSRLGTLKDPVNMFNAEPLPSYGILGNRNYELSNHLGNVLTVISDIKYPLSSDNTTIDSYEVGISNIFDYSPFGAPLDGRTIENFIAPIFDSTFIEELDANYSSDFNASNYVLPTYDGWSATNGDNVALGITNSRLRIESTATSQGAQKRFSTQSGRKVYVSFNLDRGTASQVKMSAEDIDSQENHTLNETESYTSNGVKTFVFTANENEFTLKLTGNGTFSVKDIVIKDSTFMLVDFTDFENPVYIEPLVDKWTYNPKNTKVYFENSAVHFEPNKNEPIKWNQSFSATVSPSNTYRVRGNFTFENTANSQKSMDLMLYRLNTAGTAIVDSLIVATITSDGAFNYVLPITISTSYIIGWKTSKSAKFKLTSYSVTVSVTGSFSYTLNLQTGIFNNPQIIKPSYDGWTIDTKRQNLIYSDRSTYCLLPKRGIHKNFITQANGQYKFSGDVKYSPNLVVFPPIGLADTEEETIIPQSLSTPDSLKITNISSTPVRITGVQFNGTTQIEKNFQATSNATQIEFLLGSVLEIGYAYYVDNLKLEKIIGGSTLYTSNFTTQEIVSFDLDGWKTNWETSYLSATTDTPNKLRVAGETPQTNRLFNVTSGLEYELSYTQSENNSVSFSIEESDNGTTWQNIVSNASSNGTQTVSFIPSASFLKVSFEASAGFKLQDVSLNGELFDTLVVAKTLGGTGYRYGFNGQEKDNEVSGKGNSYTAEFWQYSPRLGKRWNIDPVVKPHESPYATFANNPIWFVDPSGADTLNYSNTMKDSHAEKAGNDLLLGSESYKGLFEEFISGKFKEMTLEFKSDNLEAEGATGKAELLYKGTNVNNLNVEELPLNASLNDFTILITLDNNLPEVLENGGRAWDDIRADKIVDLTHELTLHANSYLNIINDNINKSGGIDLQSLAADYQNHIKNAVDHKNLRGGNVPLLYKNTSKEIIEYHRNTIGTQSKSNNNRYINSEERKRSGYIGSLKLGELLEIFFEYDEKPK